MEIDKLCRALQHPQPLPGSLQGHRLQQELRAFVQEQAATSYYAQRQLLLSAGQPADHAYFVADGFARGFFYDPQKGRDLTVFLWDAPSVVLAAGSFFLRQPSDIYIEVMAGSTLLSLSHAQVTSLLERFPAAEAYVRLLTLQYNAFHKKRTRDLLTRTAWERYGDLLESHPGIEQKVSQEVIASYLGITPWSLSRLKKQYR